MPSKKQTMRNIYRWGFGDLLNEIFGLVEYINIYNEGLDKIPQIKQLYKKLRKHYKEIDAVILKSKSDKELVNVRNCKRNLPKLGTLLKEFEKNPKSKKVTKQILDIIIYIREEGEKFRLYARKYGVVSGDESLKI